MFFLVLLEAGKPGIIRAGSNNPPFYRAGQEQRKEHLARLGVLPWHEIGLQGQGMVIAVLDSGFRDYRKFLGQGLPDHVQVQSFRKDGNLEARDSQHGILCGEVVHALVPRARLLFANWDPDSPPSFLDAVRWARNKGARILTCSVIMPGWSDGEGGGPTHAALAELLGAGQTPRDALFFACAGNTAQRHWSGSFRPDLLGNHQWQPGQPHNTLYPWGKDRVTVELYGPTAQAYHLQVLDVETGAEVKTSLPLEKTSLRFEPQPLHRYQVMVRCSAGKREPEKKFHLVILGGSLEYPTSQASIPFPGDGARVVAVGAVNRQWQRLSYSSCGPNPRRPKPDFVAEVPFQTLCREIPFSGTSAAAPQAAGLAALLWSSHPDWSPDQVQETLRAASLDLDPPGHDCETGYGLIRMPSCP